MVVGLYVVVLRAVLPFWCVIARELRLIGAIDRSARMMRSQSVQGSAFVRSSSVAGSFNGHFCTREGLLRDL